MSTSHLRENKTNKHILQYCEWQHGVLPKDHNLTRKVKDFTLEWKPGYSSTIGRHYPKFLTPDRDLHFSEKVSPSLPNLSTYPRSKSGQGQSILEGVPKITLYDYMHLYASFLYHLRYQDVQMYASPFNLDIP